MNIPQYVKFKNGSYVKISSRGYSSGYMLTGDVIRGREFADDNIQLRSMIRDLASRNGGVLKESLKKETLNEGPDNVSIIPEEGNDLDRTTLYYYTKENVLTALTLKDDSEVAGFSSVNNSVIAYTGSPEGDEKLKKTLEPFLKMFIDRSGPPIDYTNKFGDDIRIKSIYGHYDLSIILRDYLDNRSFDYNSDQRIRVFLVGGGPFIFTMGGGDRRGDYRNRKNIIDIIIKVGGLDVTKLLFEVSGDSYTEWNNYSKTKTVNGLLLSYDELFNSTTVKNPEPPVNNQPHLREPTAENPPGVEKSPVALDHEIKKKIYSLNKQKSELQSDEHVKGATWSKQERMKARLDLKNVEIALTALNTALRNGEVDIEKVVINTLDRLESENDGEVVPADVLYAELERKLSRYGTSAVQILQKLKSMGVDPKKALREIMEKYGENIKLSELTARLDEYVNEDKTVLKETDINVEELDTLAKSFPDLEVSLTPYPSKQMVKLELLKARKTAAPGTGTAFMEALCEWADRNKILLTLQTGRFDKAKVSDDFKTTTSENRLKKFYKRFGFISNYGRVYRPDLGGNMHRPIKDNTMKKKIVENSGGDNIYAEYVREMRGEQPFMMGDKKYQYVMAKYPSGKEDIGVYAFQGDLVYTYDHFRKMYNLKEDVNKSLREIISRKIASVLKESHEEKRTKTSGTVNVSGEDYDYVATVDVVIHSGSESPVDRFSQPEKYADADIQSFDVVSITPEPANDIVSELVYKAIQQDIYNKGGWDLD